MFSKGVSERFHNFSLALALRDLMDISDSFMGFQMLKKGFKEFEKVSGRFGGFQGHFWGFTRVQGQETLSCQVLHSLVIFAAQKRAIKNCVWMDDFFLVFFPRILPNNSRDAHAY